MTTNSMGLEQTLSDEQLILLRNAIARGERIAAGKVTMAIIDELLACRKASKEPVAYADPIALQGFSNFREHPGSDIIIRGRERIARAVRSVMLKSVTNEP